MQKVLGDLEHFDSTFIGIVDMTDRAYSAGVIVVPALIIALLAGVFQFFQIRQLQPETDKKKKKRGIRQILKDSQAGKEPDMSELNAATASKMTMIMPLLITFIAASSPAGLALYFATGGLTGFLQQRYVLGQDVKEMEEMKITTTVKTQPSTKKKRTPRKSKKG
jgi:membrane protein insertase Oxa1/YidC/SpoIIIJ